MSVDFDASRNQFQAQLFRATRQMAVILTMSFLFVSGGLVFWQIAKADELWANPSNLRMALYSETIQRGGIFDCNGKTLAITKESADAEGNKKYVRSYPMGDACAPWLGYVSTRYGSSGLEKERGETLLGLTGGSGLDMLKREFSDHKKGYDIGLTIDADLQKVASDALNGRVGSAVVMNPKTGAVLALVSQPGFDPNTIVGEDVEQNELNWSAIVGKNNSPMANHAFGLYPPGSVMKIVSSGALFMADIDTGELYHCSGSTVVNGQTITEQNMHAHGWVNYDLALAYSCNTYFADKGLLAGQECFKKTVSAFGFGESIPFDLPVSKSSISGAADLGGHMDANLLASSCFGQGEVLVSPFHMALVVSAVANEGKMMAPYMVERVMGGNGAAIETTKPQMWRQPLTPVQADRIKSAMIMAVQEGTAQPGHISGVTVAAKTGSAEPGGEAESHAWYAAFAPAENPQVAIVVMVENGGSGGQTAAPIAKGIMEQALMKKGGGN